MEVNINSKVDVNLTPKGVDIVKEYIDPNIKGNIAVLSIYDLMKYFGSTITNRCEGIEDGKFTIVKHYK